MTNSLAMFVISGAVLAGCATGAPEPVASAPVGSAPVTAAPVARAPVAPAPSSLAAAAPAPVTPPMVAPAPGLPRWPEGISVTGTAKVTVKPDTALVEVGAEGRARSVGDATADVGHRMRAILERVKSLGIEERDITTLVFTVEPLTAPRPSDHEPALIVGYRAINIMQLRIRNLHAVALILDTAVAAGANTVRGLVLTVSDPSGAQATARALAMRNAAARARELAQAAGVDLGDLISLSEGMTPQAGRIAATAAVSGAMLAEQPAPLEIVATVTAHYRVAK
jgi:uncharacterized protein YggE